MSNIKLVFKNDYDDATLVDSPAFETNLPVENTQVIGRSYVGRTTDDTQTITGTFGTSKTVDTLGIARYTTTTSATIKLTLKLSSVQVFTQTWDLDKLIPLGTWQAGINPFGGINKNDIGRTSAFHFASTACDEFEIIITDTSNTDGYFDIGRIVLGASFSPTYNFSYGASTYYQDGIEQVRSESGGLYSTGSGQHRQFDISLDWLSDSDRMTLELLMLKHGRTKDLLVSKFPGVGGDKEMLGTMIAKRGEPPVLTQNFYNNSQNTLTLLEV